MPRFKFRSPGITAIRDRLTEARSELNVLLKQTVDQKGEEIVQALRDAAPKGTSEGRPPEGDADGTLADSFTVETNASAHSTLTVNVHTSQPTKLKSVRYGTGIYGPRGEPIVPVKARALYWEGADHPYRSVRGQRPNDFVTPILNAASQDNNALDVVVNDLTDILEGN